MLHIVINEMVIVNKVFLKFFKFEDQIFVLNIQFKFYFKLHFSLISVPMVFSGFIPFLLRDPFLLYSLSRHPSPSLVRQRAGISQDTCPIRTLLKVVERGCQLWSYYSSVICTLMQLIRLVKGIECRGVKYILQETCSHHSCSQHCHFSSLGAFSRH